MTALFIDDPKYHHEIEVKTVSSNSCAIQIDNMSLSVMYRHWNRVIHFCVHDIRYAIGWH